MNENLIVRLEESGVLTSTFRRLSPAKKERIYRAAITAFAENAFDRVALDAIAAAGQLSKGSLIQYFARKENLLEFVSAVFLDNYEAFIEEYFAREKAIRARERVGDFILALYDLWDNEKILCRFYIRMRYECDADTARLFRAGIVRLHSRYLGEIIRRGIETGEIRGDLDKDIIIAASLSVIRYLELSHYSIAPARPKVNIENHVRSLVAILFEGIAR
jgi:AcrR family transcriptional regulator